MPANSVLKKLAFSLIYQINTAEYSTRRIPMYVNPAIRNILLLKFHGMEHKPIVPGLEGAYPLLQNGNTQLQKEVRIFCMVMGRTSPKTLK